MSDVEKASQDDPPEKEETIDEEVKHLVERLRQRVQRRQKRRRNNAEEHQIIDGFSLSLSGRVDNLNVESLKYVFDFIANESEGQIGSLSFIGVWIQPKPLQSSVQFLLDHQKCASIESLAFLRFVDRHAISQLHLARLSNMRPFSSSVRSYTKIDKSARLWVTC